MQRTLRSRIERLEKRAPPTTAHDRLPDISREELRVRLEQIFAGTDAASVARKAEEERRKGLPLEEQLEHAKADLEKTLKDERGRFPFFVRFGEAAVRELEIDMLERDGKIDGDTAQSLRDNADSHVRYGALAPLPCQSAN